MRERRSRRIRHQRVSRLHVNVLAAVVATFVGGFPESVVVYVAEVGALDLRAHRSLARRPVPLPPDVIRTYRRRHRSRWPSGWPDLELHQLRGVSWPSSPSWSTVQDTFPSSTSVTVTVTLNQLSLSVVPPSEACTTTR